MKSLQMISQETLKSSSYWHNFWESKFVTSGDKENVILFFFKALGHLKKLVTFYIKITCFSVTLQHLAGLADCHLQLQLGELRLDSSVIHRTKLSLAFYLYQGL